MLTLETGPARQVTAMLSQAPAIRQRSDESEGERQPSSEASQEPTSTQSSSEDEDDDEEDDEEGETDSEEQPNSEPSEEPASPQSAVQSMDFEMDSQPDVNLGASQVPAAPQRTNQQEGGGTDSRPGEDIFVVQLLDYDDNNGYSFLNRHGDFWSLEEANRHAQNVFIHTLRMNHGISEADALYNDEPPNYDERVHTHEESGLFFQRYSIIEAGTRYKVWVSRYRLYSSGERATLYGCT